LFEMGLSKVFHYLLYTTRNHKYIFQNPGHVIMFSVKEKKIPTLARSLTLSQNHTQPTQR